MDLGFLILALSSIFNTAAFSTCNPTTLYASTKRSSISINAAAYDCRIINIRPYTHFSSNWYYLELSWSSSHFDVKGNMPFCTEDYLEVYLMRSFRSIGKFCSNNAGKPFTMYSSDGYARMFYSTNGYASNSGFTFYYQLRTTISDYLGYLSSSACDNSIKKESSGVIYSAGWPFYNKMSYSPCSYKIFKNDSYQGVHLVFMDISMYCLNPFLKDYVQLYGSNTPSNYSGKTISSKWCSTSGMKTYNTYSSYLIIEFHKGLMHSQSYRGFLAGYILFSAPLPLIRPSALLPTSPPTRSYTSTKPKKNPVDEQYSNISSKSGILLGVLIPVFIITIIVVAVIIYKKNKERNISGAADQAHPLTNMPESLSHQITFQQTLQTAVPPTYNTIECSQLQDVYPTAPMQTAMNSTGSHHNEHPTTQYYSNGQCDSTGDVPPQYSSMFTPTNSSTQAGTLQESLEPVVHRQDPAGALNCDPSAATYNGESTPPLMPLVDSPPSTPPPSYQEVIKS